MDLDEFDGEFLVFGSGEFDDGSFFVNVGADDFELVVEEGVEEVLGEEFDFGEEGFGVGVHGRQAKYRKDLIIKKRKGVAIQNFYLDKGFML